MYPQIRFVAFTLAGALLAAELFPPLPLANYDRPATQNAIAKLALSLDADPLQYSPDFGYLPSLLQRLKIPVSSQVLVFSKTSFQATRISPRTPRAIYHSPDVYIGWVRGGDVIEIAATDAQHGVVFYTLDQERVRRPRFERRGQECLQCHVGAATLHVPGLVVRSVVTNRTGLALFPGPSYLSDTRSPLHQRWGGWYVSGTHGKARHMGNVFVESGAEAQSLDTNAGANQTSLEAHFNTATYLAPHSDLVSLMVLEHQSHAVNVLTRALYEERQGAVAKATLDEAAAVLSLRGQATWTEPLKGSSTFARDYSAPGRELDLKTKLYRAARSPMLDSPLYRALSDATRAALRERMSN